MHAPHALLKRIATQPAMAEGQTRLVVVLSQLGDFDSLEYAQALVQAWDQIAAASIQVHAIGIGDDPSACLLYTSDAADE